MTNGENDTTILFQEALLVAARSPNLNAITKIWNGTLDPLIETLYLIPVATSPAAISREWDCVYLLLYWILNIELSVIYCIIL